MRDASGLFLFSFMVKAFWGDQRWNRWGRGRKGERLFLLFYPFSFLSFYPLFVVVRLTFYNSTCAIERLGKDKAHHLMREGHLGEGNLLVGAVVDRL